MASRTEIFETVSENDGRSVKVFKVTPVKEQRMLDNTVERYDGLASYLLADGSFVNRHDDAFEVVLTGERLKLK